MWRLWLVLAVGCNQLYGLEQTRSNDASTFTLPDFDVDGFPDVEDNCPMIANADQSDADGDLRGDRCDECPVVASAPGADFDGDKVGDICDPHPDQVGDCLFLVDNFLDPDKFDSNWDVTIEDPNMASTIDRERGRVVLRPSMTAATMTMTVKGTSGLVDVTVLGTTLDRTASVAAVSSVETNMDRYGCRLESPPGANAEGPGTSVGGYPGLVPANPITSNLLLRLITSNSKVPSTTVNVSCRVDYGVSVGTSERLNQVILDGPAGVRVAFGPAAIEAVAMTRVQVGVPCTTIYR